MINDEGENLNEYDKFERVKFKMIMESQGGISLRDLNNMTIPNILRYIDYFNDYSEETKREINKGLKK